MYSVKFSVISTQFPQSPDAQSRAIYLDNRQDEMSRSDAGDEADHVRMAPGREGFKYFPQLVARFSFILKDKRGYNYIILLAITTLFA